MDIGFRSEAMQVGWAPNLGHTGAWKDRHRFQLFEPAHGTSLSTVLPTLSRLLIDKLALAERIGATSRVGPQGGCCRLLRSRRTACKRIGPCALRLDGLRLWLRGLRLLG